MEQCIADEVWFVQLTTASVVIAAIVSVFCSFLLVVYQTRKILRLSTSDNQTKTTTEDKDVPKGTENGDKIAGVIARIIINIALIDAVVASSHFWGAVQNYYLPKMATNGYTTLNVTVACVTQAAISVYSTYASFLWTVALGIVVVCVVRPEWNSVWAREAVSMRICSLICWGLPIFLVLGLGASDTLGFNEGLDSGWCFVRLFNKDYTGKIVGFLLSYWLWVTLMIATLLLICLIYGILVCKSLPAQRKSTSEEKGEVCTSLTKIIIATTGFAGLRLAGFIVGAIVLEKLNDPDDIVASYHCSSAYAAGMVISSIFDTSQGILNCVVFVLIPYCNCGWCWNRCKNTGYDRVN